MSRLKYIGKRLLEMIPVLFFISIGAFVMLQLTPGDAADLYITPDTTQQQIEQTREALGLNQPLFIQYFSWLSQILRGNFGYSFTNGQPVLDIISERMLPTLLLMGISLLVAYMVGIPIGITSGKNKGTWKDHLITTFTYIGISIPSFFFGLILIYIFGVELGWFPTGGMYALGTEPTPGVITWHMVLPVLVMAAGYMANMTRYTRAATINVYDSNYIRTAVAKGLDSGEIFSRHAIRNALIPIITVIGTDIPRLVGGSIVVEQVFSWPGIGSLTMTAIQQRNYPIILAVTMISAIVVLVTNLSVDVLYTFIDPRVKYD